MWHVVQRVFILIIINQLISLPYSYSDTVYLKDSRRVEGTIIDIEGPSVWLEINDEKTLGIVLEKIDFIEKINPKTGDLEVFKLNEKTGILEVIKIYRTQSSSPQKSVKENEEKVKLIKSQSSASSSNYHEMSLSELRRLLGQARQQANYADVKEIMKALDQRLRMKMMREDKIEKKEVNIRQTHNKEKQDINHKKENNKVNQKEFQKALDHQKSVLIREHEKALKDNIERLNQSQKEEIQAVETSKNELNLRINQLMEEKTQLKNEVQTLSQTIDLNNKNRTLIAIEKTEEINKLNIKVKDAQAITNALQQDLKNAITLKSKEYEAQIKMISNENKKIKNEIENLKRNENDHLNKIINLKGTEIEKREREKYEQVLAKKMKELEQSHQQTLEAFKSTQNELYQVSIQRLKNDHQLAINESVREVREEESNRYEKKISKLNTEKSKQLSKREIKRIQKEAYEKVEKIFMKEKEDVKNKLNTMYLKKIQELERNHENAIKSAQENIRRDLNEQIQLKLKQISNDNDAVKNEIISLNNKKLNVLKSEFDDEKEKLMQSHQKALDETVMNHAAKLKEYRANYEQKIALIQDRDNKNKTQGMKNIEESLTKKFEDKMNDQKMNYERLISEQAKSIKGDESKIIAKLMKDKKNEIDQVRRDDKKNYDEKLSLVIQDKQSLITGLQEDYKEIKNEAEKEKESIKEEVEKVKIIYQNKMIKEKQKIKQEIENDLIGKYKRKRDELKSQYDRDLKKERELYKKQLVLAIQQEKDKTAHKINVFREQVEEERLDKSTQNTKKLLKDINVLKSDLKIEKELRIKEEQSAREMLKGQIKENKEQYLKQLEAEKNKLEKEYEENYLKERQTLQNAYDQKLQQNHQDYEDKIALLRKEENIKWEKLVKEEHLIMKQAQKEEFLEIEETFEEAFEERVNAIKKINQNEYKAKLDSEKKKFETQLVEITKQNSESLNREKERMLKEFNESLERESKKSKKSSQRDNKNLVAKIENLEIELKNEREMFKEKLNIEKELIQKQYEIKEFLRLADFHENESQFESALVYYKKIISIKPLHADALEGMKRLSKKVENEKNQQIQGYFVLAKQYEKKGRWEEAYRAYQAILAINSHHQKAREKMIEIKEILKGQKSIEEFKENIAKKASILKFIADGSVRNVRKVHRQNMNKSSYGATAPVQPSVLHLGQTISQVTDKDQKIAPLLENIQIQIAGRNYEKAIGLCEEVLVLDPKNVDAFKALSTISKRKKINTLHSKAHQYRKLGKHQSTLKIYQEILELDQHDKVAKHWMEKMMPDQVNEKVVQVVLDSKMGKKNRTLSSWVKAAQAAGKKHTWKTSKILNQNFRVVLTSTYRTEVIEYSWMVDLKLSSANPINDKARQLIK